MARKIKYIHAPPGYAILGLKEQKAIKEHKCSICKGLITKGEVYTVATLIPMGRKKYINKKACLMHPLEDIFNKK